MHIDEIKRLYNARPFQPFELLLDDGAALPVEDWMFISFPPGGNRVHVAVGGDGWTFIDVERIVKLQVLGKRRNIGQSKRRKAA